MTALGFFVIVAVGIACAVIIWVIIKNKKNNPTPTQVPTQTPAQTSPPITTPTITASEPLPSVSVENLSASPGPSISGIKIGGKNMTDGILYPLVPQSSTLAAVSPVEAGTYNVEISITDYDGGPYSLNVTGSDHGSTQCINITRNGTYTFVNVLTNINANAVISLEATSC